jgi:Predicted restriction endonuclease
MLYELLRGTIIVATWAEDVRDALRRLGGDAVYEDIYTEIDMNGEHHLSDYPKSFTASIRNAVETHSSESKNFKNRKSEDDWFVPLAGIGAGYWGLRETQYVTNMPIDLTENDSEFPEGKLVMRAHLRRERNLALVKKAKQRFLDDHGSLYCEACGFSYVSKYKQAIAADFIEAHHMVPVSTLNDESVTKIEDMAMLCADCHRMVHRFGTEKITSRPDLKLIFK